MTLLSTKYHSAPNWCERLNIAREIWAEVRTERVPESGTNKLFQIEEQETGRETSVRGLGNS